MFCSKCKKDKNPFDFVLPDTYDICRKCHSLTKNIDDEDFIVINKITNQTILMLIELIEQTEEDINNSNIEKYISYTPEDYIDYLHNMIEKFNMILKYNEQNMKQVKIITL